MNARVAQKKSKPALKRGRRWPVALTVAAPRCGVSIHHLAEVLRGNRQSKRIIKLYEALKEELGV